jgi:hypothetical protein
MPLRRAEEAGARSHVTIALSGAPKTGKTLTALLIARGLSGGERFAVFDTERNGTLLYGELGFDVETDMRDFSTQSYLEFIRACDGRYPVLVVDSLSHAWFGKNGVLDVANRAGQSRNGSPFGGWSVAAPEHTAFMDALLSTRSHLIVTMRVKTEWEIVRNDKGKLEPVEVGKEEVQRDGVRYEFDLTATLSEPERNLFKITGSRLRGFGLGAGWEGQRVGEDLGRQLRAWLENRGSGGRAALEAAVRAKLGPAAELLLSTGPADDVLRTALRG